MFEKFAPFNFRAAGKKKKLNNSWQVRMVILTFLDELQIKGCCCPTW